MMKSILFWTVIVCVLYLAASGVLLRFRLIFRVWIREPVTLLIAAGTFAGILQLLLHISSITVRIVTIVLWAAALIVFCIYGFVFLILTHRSEISGKADFNGTRCIVENEPVMWESRRRYYAYRGWFVRGKTLLHAEGYACGTLKLGDNEE